MTDWICRECGYAFNGAGEECPNCGSEEVVDNTSGFEEEEDEEIDDGDMEDFGGRGMMNARKEGEDGWGD